MDFEERLRRLEDRTELQDLIVRYFVSADDDNYAALENTLAPDVVFGASGFGDAVGREAVMAFLISSRAEMGQTVHTPNYQLVEFQSDARATGQVGAHLELSRGGRALFGAVRYLDEYVRLPEGWRILTRRMLIIHISPWEEVGQSFVSDKSVRWPGYDPLPSDLPKKVVQNG